MSQPLLKYREPVTAQDILTEAMPRRIYTEGSALNLARAALFGVPLYKVESIVELLRLYRGGKPNSIIIGGPLGWAWQATLDTTHHGALAGPANAHQHSDLANVGPDDHHNQLHPTEHQDGGVQEISIAGLSGEPAELTTHKGLPDVHHTTFTTTEHDVVARHPLGTVVPHDALASLTEKAHGSLTGVTSDQHHPQAHTLGSHSTKSHDELTGVTASQHHTKYVHPTTGTCPQAPKAHNQDASTIISGRFPMTRMPDMALNKVMVGRGAGVSPVEETKPVGVPSGVIAMWHGLIASIPSGWVICDGNSGTPNLLARFVEGVATAGTNPGATGGATAKTTSGHQHDVPIAFKSGFLCVGDHPYGTGAGFTSNGEVALSAPGLSPSATRSSNKTDSISDIRPLFYDVAFIMKT